MRTTIRIQDRLLEEVKHFAHESGKSLTTLVQEGLRLLLQRHRTPPKKKVSLTTFKGKGVHLGVDLDDTSELLDRMDGE